MPVINNGQAAPTDANGVKLNSVLLPDGTVMVPAALDGDSGAGARYVQSVQLVRPASGGEVALAKADGAAFAANTDFVVPVGGRTAAGLARAPLLSVNREQAIYGEHLTLALNGTTPAPSGSDLTNTADGALVAADFLIRDTTLHTYVIPMAGYARLALDCYLNAQFDQALTLQLLASGTRDFGLGQLLSVTIPASTALAWTISPGAGGQGAVVGGGTLANQAHYAVPALADRHVFYILTVFAGVAPTAGELVLIVNRSRN